MTAEFVVVHDRIGRRAVCAVGAVCGDRAIIGIGTADDDEDDARDRQDAHAKAKRAGLRALRRFASKAAPIVLTAAPGGNLAREASTALLESRRAASDVQTAREHAQQVTGLLSPLAVRVIGSLSEEAQNARTDAQARSILDAINEFTRRELWPFYARLERVRRGIESLPANRRQRAGEEAWRRYHAQANRLSVRLADMELRLDDLAYAIELVDPQHPARSLYRLVPLWETDAP
jgi:hypothetical protein